MNVIERFLKYVSFDTTSCEESTSVPTTEKQKVLGAELARELKEIGLENAELDKFGYVYGFLPATDASLPKIGFISHMDTSPAVSGTNVKPTRINYSGGDIKLNESVSIEVEKFPFLSRHEGEELIVTDGTTLLGADDKAGIAEIFTAVEYLKNHPEIPHGKICVAITPDEEVGSGADHFDIDKFDADFAYTIDGGALGELEYENFNAAGAKIEINGVNIHPGSAKNKMKNAVLIAAELISMLPPSETPAHTEGYEGFYHVCDISGNESLSKLSIIIRDHDREKFENRKKFIINLCNYLNSVYGEDTVILKMADSYYNMKEKILPVIHIIERAKKAMLDNGVEPIVQPIRGGTDGARLSFMGLPCPNLSTGGYNFHSIHEFASVPEIEKTVDIIISIATAK